MPDDTRSDARPVALVTGGSKGIGAAIVDKLAREGFAVMVNYHRSAKAAAALIDRLRAAGAQAEHVQADVSDPEQAKATVAATLDAFGRLDAVVNNAGVATFGPIEEVTPHALEREFAVNVGSLVWMTQASIPHLVSSGSIINVSSVVASGGPPGSAVYAASKAAVSAFTQVLAAELGSRGIRVNAVAPGPVRTDMYVSDLESMFLERTPLGRIAEPSDIADVVASLARKDMRWITGETVTASGGFRF